MEIVFSSKPNADILSIRRVSGPEFSGNVGNRAVNKSGISGRKQTDRREFQWLAGIVGDDPPVAPDIGVEGVGSKAEQ